MVVFGWILFVICALAVLTNLGLWFGEGEGLLDLLQSIGLVVYLVFYLFVSPFGAVVSWIFFGVYCALLLMNLLVRKPFGTLQCATGALFILLAVL